MPEDKTAQGKGAGSALGDIIGATRQRLDAPAADPASLLKDLVATTARPAPVQTPREPAPSVLPPNYFPQIPVETSAGAGAGAIIPKRKPQRGPARSLHISMRLSPPERDRLVRWCDDRNLSLPDGVMALLDLVEREGGANN